MAGRLHYRISGRVRGMRLASSGIDCFTKGVPMLATYLVAFGAMLFSAISALTLFYTIGRFNPPEAPQSKAAREEVTV
jgi:hypothetical protein